VGSVLVEASVSSNVSPSYSLIQRHLMASRKLPNYLRSYRKRLGLSQREVGFLLGGLTGDSISTHERFRKQPGIEGMFAYAIVFRSLSRDLFSGVFQDAERTVRRRARRLAEKLAKQPSRANARKLELLRAIGGTCPSR
jgi:DNA-binding XRE family transcriptional regulator